MGLLMLDQAINRLLLGGPEMIGAFIIAHEIAHGFTVIRPGDVEWFPLAQWDRRSIASICGQRVRLVALDARNPGQGSLRALIAAIERAGYVPVIVEPSNRLTASLKRWGWKHRRLRRGSEAESIWYPR